MLQSCKKRQGAMQRHAHLDVVNLDVSSDEPMSDENDSCRGMLAVGAGLQRRLFSVFRG